MIKSGFDLVRKGICHHKYIRTLQLVSLIKKFQFTLGFQKYTYSKGYFVEDRQKRNWILFVFKMNPVTVSNAYVKQHKKSLTKTSQSANASSSKKNTTLTNNSKKLQSQSTQVKEKKKKN